MVLIREILNKADASQLCGNLEVRKCFALPQSAPGLGLCLLHFGGTAHAYVLTSLIIFNFLNESITSFTACFGLLSRAAAIPQDWKFRQMWSID